MRLLYLIILIGIRSLEPVDFMKKERQRGREMRDTLKQQQKCARTMFCRY